MVEPGRQRSSNGGRCDDRAGPISIFFVALNDGGVVAFQFGVGEGGEQFDVPVPEFLLSMPRVLH